MRRTYPLLQHTARVTLYSRTNCSLCDTAKATVNQLAKKRSVDYSIIDVMAVDQEQWRDLYEFDTPVVCISFQSVGS